MFDRDLAELYQAKIGILNRAVKRNKQHFPEDFLLPITPEEFSKCPIGISKCIGESGCGGRRCMPYVLAEKGESMLSDVYQVLFP